MLTAWFTIISLLILFVVLISKLLFLAKRGIFKNKDFLWASIELAFSGLALAFLIVVMVTNAYYSTLDNLALVDAFESSAYLYVGSFLFLLIGFLFTIEVITIFVRDIYEGRKGFMPSKKKNFANMQN